MPLHLLCQNHGSLSENMLIMMLEANPHALAFLEPDGDCPMAVLWSAGKRELTLSLLGSGLLAGQRALAFVNSTHNASQAYMQVVLSHTQLELSELVHRAVRQTAQFIDDGIAELRACELRGSWAVDHGKQLERAWAESQEASVRLYSRLYVLACTNVLTHARTYVHTWSTHISTCTYIYAHLHTCLHACLHVCLCMSTHVSTQLLSSHTST